MDDNVFEVNNPYGQTIYCSRQQWENHILQKKIMIGKEAVVKNTIKDPIYIIGSDEYTNRDVYFSEFGGNNKLVSKVIVDNDTSSVITAFPQIDISGNINVEVIKYVRPKLR